MKILFITLEYPPQKGGVASYYRGVVEELKRQGHEVEVISGGPSSGRPEDGPLLYRWIWPKWLKGYFLVRKLIYRGSTSGVEVEPRRLLFVGHLLPLGTIAYLLRRRVPYVVFTHGMDVLMAQKSWQKRWLARKILEQAKFVVANSEFTKREVEKFISGGPSSGRPEDGPQNIVVVYPCPAITPEVKHEEVEALRRRLGLTGKKVVLTLGRVVERKGHDLVIRAMPEIIKHVPEAVYVVAGVGEDLGRIGKMVEEMKLQTAVRFVGKISDEERPLYYALCDLFVMPSRQIGPDVEGFGLSFLEAAVFGKPSIGGRSGGQGEAILDGKTGALVDPSDANALARVVVQLLRDDRLRKELGQNAKARAVYEFTWERQIEKLLKVLSS